MVATQPQIEVHGLGVSFPGKWGARRTVINEVNFRAGKGELITLMGSTGAGKSVLMKVLFGALRPTSGEVWDGGQRVERVTRQRGMVYQHHSLFRHLTVLENIAFGPLMEHTNLPTRMAYTPLLLLEEAGLKRFISRMGLFDRIPVWSHFREVRRASLEQARNFLERIKLGAVDGGEYPHDLSGGMRQRVAVARALIMRPDVLFMDEPFGALDPVVRRGMQEWLLELWKEFGLTIVFVTHDEEEGLYVATRFIALSKFWRFNDGSPGVGSKIVYDIKVPNALAQSSDWRTSEEFRRILAEMRLHALTESHCQRLSECIMTHPDAIPHKG